MTPDTLGYFDRDDPPAHTAPVGSAEAVPFHRQVAEGVAQAHILRGRAVRQALATVFLLPLRLATMVTSPRAAKGRSPAAASR
ncbi:hypothetical protein HH303_11315 [Rhodospirillaceae bacterium KN72]|uniref:Uncharacterized protein n=1 Tax=Pacificispira spongiicola TaxID=2729598 RepID=A0A7Y0E0P5_9PROT|nr:hypothetical protein [Pacificispira spongiicola]NMM45070.1 hypothetical protein [Pacificispira spongiicola]